MDEFDIIVIGIAHDVRSAPWRHKLPYLVTMI